MWQARAPSSSPDPASLLAFAPYRLRKPSERVYRSTFKCWILVNPRPVEDYTADARCVTLGEWPRDYDKDTVRQRRRGLRRLARRGRALVRVRDFEERRLAPRTPEEIHAHRQSIRRESRGHTHRR